MKKALRLLLNLHYGEEKRALLFLFLGLIWGTGCYGTTALSECLFLESLGTEKLPSAYLGSSSLLCIFSSLILYNSFKKRASPKTLFLIPITSFIACNIFLLFHALLYREIPHPSLFLYRIVSLSLLTLCYTNFWGFVDQFFNLQDAKRHFSIFNAVIFLSDALGAGIVHKIQTIGVHRILILLIVILLICYPIVHYVSVSLKELSDDHDHFIDTGHPPPASKALKLCLRDNYTLCLLLLYFLMQLLTVAMEFNFLSIFERNFGIGTYALTAYLTKCSAWISLINMCFALFAYSRIVKNIGINNIILLAPLCFGSMFLCLSFKTSLGLATISMVARETLAYALDDNNLQLLIYGVPNRIRNQIRIVIECFIEPIGMSVWSLVLLTVSYQHTLCLIVSSCAIILAFLLRSYYARAILQSLSSQAIYLKRTMVEWLKTMTSKEKRQTELLLLSHLKHQQERNQICAFQHLLNLGSRSVLPNLLTHMNKLSLLGKLKTMEMLKNSLWAKDFLTLELLKRWSLVTPHPAIAMGIHLYFAEHDLLQVGDIADDLYEQPGNKLLAAILTVRRQEKNSQYRDIADEQLQKLLSSTDPKIVVLGLTVLTLEKNADNFPTLIEFLDHKHPDVFLQTCKALHASVKVTHKPYCRKLIQVLRRSIHNQEACHYLLNTISITLDTSLIKELIVSASLLKTASRRHAEAILTELPKETGPAFVQVLSDNNLHNRCRLLAAKSLSKIDNKLLKKSTYKILKSKALKSNFYAYHANYIQDHHPKYNLNLLVKTLESNYRSEVNFMFEFLGILSSVDHSDVLIRALTKKNKKAKAQAIESLEKSCDSYLFSLIVPFIEEQVMHSKKHYLKLGITPLSLKELLNMMENSPSHLSKLVAKQLKEELAICDVDFQTTPSYTPLHTDDDQDTYHNQSSSDTIPFFTI